MAARALAVLLVLAQAFAMFIAPVHRVAHAAVQPVFAVEHAIVAQGSESLFDQFGHAAGASCDDWNAAFAHDFNPGSAQIHALPVAAGLPVCSGRLPPPAASHPHGLSLARAPPRL